MADAIARIARAEIPVMGHVGLTPQSVHRMGGFRVQGRSADERARVLADAEAVQAAGAFAVVLEGMPVDLAAEITRSLEIPTIGIGAGPHCDGQVLVMHDMLGLNDWTPSFVKQYADLGAAAAKAARAFADDVDGAEVSRRRNTATARCRKAPAPRATRPADGAAAHGRGAARALGRGARGGTARGAGADDGRAARRAISRSSRRRAGAPTW